MDHLTVNDVAARVDTLWVLVAGVLVFFMQAGFLLLEVGFSRMKNAGTVVAKVIANLSICAVCYWAVGFALAFGATKMPAPGQTAGWFSGNAGERLRHVMKFDPEMAPLSQWTRRLAAPDASDCIATR